MTLTEKRDALIREAMHHAHFSMSTQDARMLYKKARLQVLREAFPLNPSGIALLIAETEALL